MWTVNNVGMYTILTFVDMLYMENPYPIKMTTKIYLSNSLDSVIISYTHPFFSFRKFVL